MNLIDEVVRHRGTSSGGRVGGRLGVLGVHSQVLTHPVPSHLAHARAPLASQAAHEARGSPVKSPPVLPLPPQAPHGTHPAVKHTGHLQGTSASRIPSSVRPDPPTTRSSARRPAPSPAVRATAVAAASANVAAAATAPSTDPSDDDEPKAGPRRPRRACRARTRPVHPTFAAAAAPVPAIAIAIAIRESSPGVQAEGRRLAAHAARFARRPNGVVNAQRVAHCLGRTHVCSLLWSVHAEVPPRT